MTEPDPIDYPTAQFQDAGDDYVAWSPPLAAPSSRTCAAQVASLRDDEDRSACGAPATVEVLGTSGQWEPWCDRCTYWRGIPVARIRASDAASRQTP